MSNADWLTRSLQAVWHPCTQMKAHENGELPLIPIARGQGAWLYDCDGRRYLDAISSWWVNLFGHANPQINAALCQQLQREVNKSKDIEAQLQFNNHLLEQKVRERTFDLTEINNLLEATEIDGITDNSNNSDDIISTETKQETANKIKTKELNLWR